MGKTRRNHIDYDSVPVYYCKRCLSLNIRVRPGLGDFCAQCGGVSIGSTSIQEHKKMMMERIKKIQNGAKE